MRSHILISQLSEHLSIPLAKVDFRPPSPPSLGENTFKVLQTWGIWGAFQDLCKRSSELASRNYINSALPLLVVENRVFGNW
jgi:hypothetical protein